MKHLFSNKCFFNCRGSLTESGQLWRDVISFLIPFLLEPDVVFVCWSPSTSRLGGLRLFEVRGCFSAQHVWTEWLYKSLHPSWLLRPTWSFFSDLSLIRKVFSGCRFPAHGMFFVFHTMLYKLWRRSRAESPRISAGSKLLRPVVLSQSHKAITIIFFLLGLMRTLTEALDYCMDAQLFLIKWTVNV